MKAHSFPLSVMTIWADLIPSPILNHLLSLLLFPPSWYLGPQSLYIEQIVEKDLDQASRWDCCHTAKRENGSDVYSGPEEHCSNMQDMHTQAVTGPYFTGVLPMTATRNESHRMSIGRERKAETSSTGQQLHGTREEGTENPARSQSPQHLVSLHDLRLLWSQLPPPAPP